MEKWDQRRQAQALRVLIREALQEVDEHPNDPEDWKLAELALERFRDIKAINAEWKVT